MSTSASASAWFGAPFATIGMAALEARAPMLERLDNKYVVDAGALRRALPHLAQSFDVLEIEGRRAFAYENCYFDGPGWESYHDHHRGRRIRAKVRMRNYVGAGLCFVEVKLKDRRGITVKRRMPCDPAAFGALDAAALAHVGASYRDLYGIDFPHDLARSLDTLYTRTTLVAKDGAERLTIDSGLAFRAGECRLALGDDVFIVETKSATGNGQADRILRALHQHPVARCSKYCAGMALLQRGLKHNNFNAVLRKLGTLPVAA